MRALLPQPTDEVDLDEAYAWPETTMGRPFVRINMIESLDGAIAVRGRSGLLGGSGDRQLFRVLRSLADVILVGAGTARAEGYGPVRLDAEKKQRRRDRDQSPVPPIAVGTRSCHLDWTTPFFTEAEARPMVITTADTDQKARSRATEVADVIIAGDRDVDLADALDALGGRGARHVLCEGGPGVNAQLVTGRLADEFCLTVSPRLVAGDGSRVLAGPELPAPIDVETRHVLEDDGFLFLRLALSARREGDN